jgi:lysozyme
VGKDVDEKVALDDNTDKSLLNFNGNYEHILLYKAFVQAGDNYKSVVLPLRNPEATTTPDSNPPLVKVQQPQEVGYTFNVENKDSFVIVGGSMSGMEFTIVPNDGTTYIVNESPINNLDDEDMLSDEYSEGEFLGIEDSSTKIEYSPTGDDKQAVVTDTTTLAGPVEITKPKDGSMTISTDGLKRLKKHEGSRATVYDDKTGKSVSSWGEVAGFPTIGVGHLIQNNEKTAFSKFLKPGKMSDNEIDNLLLKDLQERINALNKKLKVKVSQNQFDSLLSMMFNTGGANKSFLKAISLTNEGKFKDAAAQIKSGPKSSKGVILAGLERRRNEEAETYLA